MDVVEFLPGLAYLVGALNRSLDNQTGCPKEVSIQLATIMILCGYQANEDSL
jgi:hypothetical protein